MLEETRRELAEARERAQLSATHTFSPLPGFFDRPAELKAIERALEGEPSFTILFGASSVGKVCDLSVSSKTLSDPLLARLRCYDRFLRKTSTMSCISIFASLDLRTWRACT